jgi:MFS superfamily sulfate permease-like transporter
MNMTVLDMILIVVVTFSAVTIVSIITGLLVGVLMKKFNKDKWTPEKQAEFDAKDPKEPLTDEQLKNFDTYMTRQTPPKTRLFKLDLPSDPKELEKFFS